MACGSSSPPDINPCADFERGILPQNVDVDPTWRDEATYAAPEIALLISAEALVNGDRFSLIRRRQTMEDLIREEC